eukprot:COSAG02_NODE_102_length_36716_cov_233.851025_33_plen_443_part_00
MQSSEELAIVLKEVSSLVRSISREVTAPSPQRSEVERRQLGRELDWIRSLHPEAVSADAAAGGVTELSEAKGGARSLLRYKDELASISADLQQTLPVGMSQDLERDLRPLLKLVSAETLPTFSATPMRKAAPPARASSPAVRRVGETRVLSRQRQASTENHSPTEAPAVRLSGESGLVSGGWKVLEGCAVSTAFLPLLSSKILHFAKGNATTMRPQSWSRLKDKEAELADSVRSSDAKGSTSLHPAALVAVPRQASQLLPGQCSGAFVLTVLIEQLDPGNKWFSFGIGIMLPRTGGKCFGNAEGTVGITQSVFDRKHRQVRSRGRFGRRIDRSDDKLKRPIRIGSRLCLQLSPRDTETGHRTLRFFIDKQLVVVWGEIEDGSSEGSGAAAVDSDRAWAAGLTLTRGLQARMVTPQGPELYCNSQSPQKVGGSGPAACCARPD